MIIGPNDQRFADGERFLITVREFRDLTGLDEGLAVRLPVVIHCLGGGCRGDGAVPVSCSASRAPARQCGPIPTMKIWRLLSGINPDRVVAVTWIIAASLATIAGVLYGLDKSFPALRLLPASPADLSRRPSWAASASRSVRWRAASSSPFSEVTLTYAYRRFVEYFGFEPDGLLQLLVDGVTNSPSPSSSWCWCC